MKGAGASVGTLSLDLVVRFCASQSRQVAALTQGMPQDRHWLRASDSHTLTKPHSSLASHPATFAFFDISHCFF